MSDAVEEVKSEQPKENWVSRWTTLTDIERTLIDKPSSGLEAWARTTAGVVVMLLALQVITGLLLGFYYVPSTESAHTTVAYIEKVVPAGSWIRSLHHYGSMWLTLALVLHLAQMFWRATYRRRPVAWMASVILLGLILAAGATGYSLPWDARAFFGTRVTEGIAGGLPLVGDAARRWLLGGSEISPITLARFFALHALIIPAIILTVLAARLFVFRERGLVSAAEERRLEKWMHRQVLRNAIAAGLVFIALAFYSMKYFAPLGPPADTAAPGYLPRPGAQFLWLFQMLKYLPGRAASLIAVALPGLILFGLAMLPFLKRPLGRVMAHPRRNIGAVLFSLGFLLFTGLTIVAYVDDSRNPLTRAQFRRQEAEETAFHNAPFTPLRARTSESVSIEPQTNHPNSNTGAQMPDGSPSPSPQTNGSPIVSTNNSGSPPESYITNCSACHGTRGQGASIFPKLLGVGSKPRRTVEDIVNLLNDPLAYGIEPPMKSYADKLTEDEKREIAEWVAGLKK
ncbi:MAG: ubiquinol-cytochrome c reductase cytochrome b subunit [Acidobacteriota bacterium]|jgi:ubiquinol-cytochrome c reductase cytochrome b subunit|nr:ubiquinol-cytochrome c reductase cytochrome b subunit [Acidobacteriota bacterium]